jgi:hypothetical protein
MHRSDAVIAPELLIADTPVDGAIAPAGPCRRLCCRFWLFRLLFARWCRGHDAYEAYLTGLTSELQTVFIDWDRRHPLDAR